MREVDGLGEEVRDAVACCCCCYGRRDCWRVECWLVMSWTSELDYDLKVKDVGVNGQLDPNAYPRLSSFGV